jgi:hypothetical protein
MNYKGRNDEESVSIVNDTSASGEWNYFRSIASSKSLRGGLIPI